jgi:hypothetical protein
MPPELLRMLLAAIAGYAIGIASKQPKPADNPEPIPPVAPEETKAKGKDS